MAVAGIVLHLASIGLIVIGVVRLVLVLRIDYTQPVLTIQRSLATLQEFEARSFHAVWFACWVLVPAALVAIVMGLAGVDLWERASGYLLANFVVCLVGRPCAAASALLGPSPAAASSRHGWTPFSSVTASRAPGRRLPRSTNSRAP